MTFARRRGRQAPAAHLPTPLPDRGGEEPRSSRQRIWLRPWLASARTARTGRRHAEAQVPARTAFRLIAVTRVMAPLLPDSHLATMVPFAVGWRRQLSFARQARGFPPMTAPVKAIFGDVLRRCRGLRWPSTHRCARSLFCAPRGSDVGFDPGWRGRRPAPPKQRKLTPRTDAAPGPDDSGDGGYPPQSKCLSL